MSLFYFQFRQSLQGMAVTTTPLLVHTPEKRNACIFRVSLLKQVRLIRKNYLQNSKHILRMAIMIVHLETLHFYHKVSLKLIINDNYLIIKIYNTPFPCKYDKKCI